MSRSSTTSASKQLPRRSAWARGPPANAPSSRSQSPAPFNVLPHDQTHKIRSSQLSQGVGLKDGVVSIQRGDALKQGLGVTFGTIHDAPAPISSSPVAAPAVAAAGSQKMFGSVLVNGDTKPTASAASTSSSSRISSTPTVSTSAASSTTLSASSTKSAFKMDVANLFQGSGSSQSPTAGTPTPSHAVPHISHVPHPPALSHTSSSSFSGTLSTPTTSSTGNIPLSAARLNIDAPVFVPGRARGAKISNKNSNDGAEMKIENWTKGSPSPRPSPKLRPTSFDSSGNRRPARLESEGARSEAAGKQVTVEEPEEGEVVKADAPALNSIPKPKEKDINMANSSCTGPLNLAVAKGVPISVAPMSAVTAARRIEDLGGVRYPSGIRRPNTELNVNAQGGKFRYDRDFLLQFMKICTEKPDMLPPLNTIGLQSFDQTVTRGGSRCGGQHSGAAPTSRQASTSLNFNQPSSFTSPINTFTIGQFATSRAARMSSEDRFAMSSRSASGPAGMAFGCSEQVRAAGQGDPSPMSRRRTRSKRGSLQFKTIPESLPPLDTIGLQSSDQTSHSESMTFAGQSSRQYSGSNKHSPATATVYMPSAALDYNDNTINSRSQHNDRTGYANAGATAQSSLGREVIVAPLQQSAKRWDRKAFSGHPGSPEMVDRQLRGLLNKLADKTFDSISDQIIDLVGKGSKERNGTQLMRLIFEMVDDSTWLTRLHARLCRKMEPTNSKVPGDGDDTEDLRGVAPLGVQLFEERLLQRCLTDFGKHWGAKDGTTTAEAVDASEDDEMAKGAACKAKHQALGLLKFMGQLFDLQMLGTGGTMCLRMKLLLGEAGNPEERKLEGLCALLSTAGRMLDDDLFHRPHEGRIDACFLRIQALSYNDSISPRVRFMLEDVVFMRESKWPQIGEFSSIYAYDRALGEREGRGIMYGSDSDEEVTVPASSSVKPRVSRSDLPNIDPSRARTPQEEAWRLKLLQELLDEVEEHEERGAMDEEEAAKKILDDADELFVTRDVATAEAYFSWLPTMYHQRLVKQLVSHAIELESDEVSAVMVADLFDRVASKKLCSPLAFEEGFRGFARSLEDIAIDVPKAWWFMDIMVDGVCWNEGYQRQRIVPYQMQKYYLRRESSF